ncbi:MAG TPA: citrate/2-methylcitrate synthase [Gaiellaceae bacterium]|nr:citrate/2-methylcitrate synthase [Gaiellaceae bacterium]
MTGKESVELELDEHRAFDGAQLKQLGIVSYDQPLLATATARSAITYIDGDAGILRYRGYPIEQLAEQKHFLEVAYLLAYGELPGPDERAAFRTAVYDANVDRERIAALVASFPEGSHPMAILIAGYAALGALHPEAKNVKDAAMRKALFPLVLAETLELGARAIARHAGVEPREPEGETYARRFIQACGDAVDTSLGPDALDVFGKALDVLFVLHADHELNAGTNAMRAIGSAETDMYSSLAGAAAALYGPLHGGANEAVLRMLDSIGSLENVPDYIERVKKHEVLLYGFGHRVYKNYDPRAKVIKTVVDEVLETAGANPLLDVAQELERIALEDDYFVSRKLYPNVDFYSGIAYRAIGFDPAAFTVLFAVARTVGWLCHYDELMSGDFKITRPAQIYVGPGERSLDESG